MLWLRGDLVALGEWRRGAVTGGRAVADPANPKSRIVNTGDLVRYRADGLLELLGRADEMVKIGGNRVEPAAIEQALRQHPGIADAAIIAEREGES